jgi:hypothetical protein
LIALAATVTAPVEPLVELVELVVGVVLLVWVVGFELEPQAPASRATLVTSAISMGFLT